MDFQITDAIQIIGELTYEKRLLEEELKTARQQALELLTENNSAKEKMAELEAALNGRPKKSRPTQSTEAENA